MVTTPLEWLSEFQVNNGTASQYYDSDVVQLSNGNFLVSWTTNDDTGVGSPPGSDIVGQIFDPLGNQVGSEFRLNVGFNAHLENSASITALEGGGFIVAYADVEVTGSFPAVTFTYDIRYDRFDNSGTFVTSGTIHAPAGNDVLGPPETAALSATSVMTVWLDATNADVMARVYNPGTDTLGSVLTLANLAAGAGEGVNGVEIAALKQSNRYAVSYVDVDSGNDEVYLLILDSAGGVIANSLVTNTYLDGRDTDLAELANGNIVVVRTGDDSGGTDSRVVVSVFDSAGTKLTGNLNPPTTTAGNQEYAAVAATLDGGFVVFWFDEGTKDLHGQRYGATYGKIGTEFDVENFASTNIDHIEARALEDGRILVTWTSEFNSGLEDDVYSAIWDPRDNANIPPDSNGNVIGTTQDDSFTVPTGALRLYGHTGNDTIAVASGDVDPAEHFDGGLGPSDRLSTTTGSGTWDFRGETVTNFEIFEFDAGGTHTQTARFYASQAAQFTTFDFAAIGTDRPDNLIVDMFTTDTLDLSGKTLTDYEAAFDTISIFGDGSAETITGTTGNDLISGSGGNDTLNGHGGDDTIRGGIGNDSMNGGAGIDTLDLSLDGLASVNVNLGANAITSGDTIAGFENVIGTAGDDTLLGSSSSGNVLEGRNGNDLLGGNGGGVNTLLGGANDDTLIVENGDILPGATYDGGTGTDTLAILNQAGGVTTTFDLRGSTLLSIEEIQFAANAPNAISSVSVDWTQFGATGLSAGLLVDGYDNPGDRELLYIFANGATTVDTYAFTYVDWGGQGEVTIIFGNDGPADLITGNGFHDAIFGFGGNDTLIGLGGGDELSGDDGDDRLEGGDGDDMLNGGADNDILSGGTGNDTMDGGGGTDTLDLSLDGLASVSVNLGTNFINSGDVIAGFENVIGTAGNDTLTGDNSSGNRLEGGFGDDRLEGGDGDDALNGEAGNDILFGGNNNDSLFGLAGNDTLNGQAGDDTMDGGDNDDILNGATGNDSITGGNGFDIASYFFANGGVVVTLATPGVGQNTGADQGIDTLSGIEGLYGSQLFGDSLTGDAGNNLIDGYGGNDTILGGFGADTLLGSNGNDDLRGEAGNDSIDGGNGADLIGGGNDNDILDGGTGDDSVFGGFGNDTVFGNEGNDYFNGGGDRDWLTYVNSTDAVNVNLNILPGQFVSASQGTDQIEGFENLAGSNFNDTLFGGALDNVLGGNDGNDRIAGQGGNDTMDGGLGALDMLNYYFASGGVTVDLANQGVAQAVGAGEGTDTFSNFEAVLGSNVGADSIDGDASANWLVGYGGDDSMDGGTNTDTLDGGGGNDSLRGEDGDDFLYGGADNDILGGGNDNDYLSGGVGVDSLYGGFGNDTLFGGADADTLWGGADADVFQFTAATDSVLGARDIIFDFAQGPDKIDLSAMDANANVGGVQNWSFIGAGGFTAAGQLRVVTDGTNSWALGDTNGDAVADFNLQINGVTALVAGDFILV